MHVSFFATLARRDVDVQNVLASNVAPGVLAYMARNWLLSQELA